MSNFEELIFELYNKENSKNHDTSNEKNFSCCVYLFNHGFSFSKINRKFIEEHIDSIDSLYFISYSEKFEKQIQKNLYKNHEYVDTNLIIRTHMSEYVLPLKK